MSHLSRHTIFRAGYHAVALVSVIELLLITFHLITVSAIELALTVLYLAVYVFTEIQARQQQPPADSLGTWRMWSSCEADIDAFSTQLLQMQPAKGRYQVTQRGRRWRVIASVPFVHYGWFVRVDLLKGEA